MDTSPPAGGQWLICHNQIRQPRQGSRLYESKTIRPLPLKYPRSSKPARQRSCNVTPSRVLRVSTLQTVAATFSGSSTQEIVKISHEEKAWIENINSDNHRISYLKYGFALNAL